MEISDLHRLFLACPAGVTTDSRAIKGGEMFFAIRGEKFDGNAYALKALEQGARYAVVDRDSEAAASGDERIIPASNTLQALRALATYHRENISDGCGRMKILALTGTNGKTTTKELIRAALAAKFDVAATEGNLNNNIGVPLTLLRLKEGTPIAIVEMGASHPGDIKELVDIAHPDFGLITNVGRAHLLGFGSFEGVCKTKGELYDYIRGVCGKCFVNADNEYLTKMVREREGLSTIPYGASLQQAEILTPDERNPFLRMKLSDRAGRRHLVQTHLVGSYNADNVLAAVAVAEEFGVDAEAAVKAIEAYIPVNNRSQMVRTERGNTLIVDAYNANPSSMAAALGNFASIKAARKAVLLGDMLELGAESETEHRKVLEMVLSEDIDLAVFAEENFGAAAKEAPKTFKGKVIFAPGSEEVAKYLQDNPLNGYTVLIKGSRGIAMEKVLPYL